MKQTLVVKLLPTPAQATSLLATMERFNAACDTIAAVAFGAGTSSKFAVQKLVYADVRRDFGLSAQMTIRAIAKVCEAYKRDKATLPHFRPHGAMTYDERILSWQGPSAIAILTLDGRLTVPYTFGAYQAARLDRIKGQADLVYRDRRFYLHATIETPAAPESDPTGWLGVDLGIVHLAADSDGTTYSGAQVNGLRIRHERLRKRLQAQGTRSAKRLLGKRRRKQGRFQSHTNHTIAKHIVAVAQGTHRGIALEELRGISQRVTVRKRERSRHGNWAFARLRGFVEYKARLAGVPLALVDPRNTSRECPACGHTAKENRPHRSSFLCVSCGLSGPADTIAATNVARRASVNAPYVPDAGTPPVAPGTSPRSLAVGI